MDASRDVENVSLRIMSAELTQPQRANRVYQRTANSPQFGDANFLAPTFVGRSAAGSQRAGDDFLLAGDIVLRSSASCCSVYCADWSPRELMRICVRPTGKEKRQALRS